jgi:hypothetical protein
MKPPLKSLYQYRRIEPDQKTGINYSIENLKANSIWCSKPSDFDDPFDCVLPIERKNLSNEELGAVFVLMYERVEQRAKQYYLDNFFDGASPNEKFRSELPRLTRQYFDEWRDRVSNWGIACFSETYDNVLMWAQYASGHRGFCLEFDASFLPFKEAQDVTYQSAIPAYNLLELYKDPKNVLSPMVKTKADFWKYQDEWRIFWKESQQLHAYDPKALTGIYFGCKMCSQDRDSIIKISENYRVQ